MIYIFTLTLTVVIFNLFALIALVFGNSISYPKYKIFHPTSWIFLYPSFLFQVWFWTDKLQVIT